MKKILVMGMASIGALTSVARCIQDQTSLTVVVVDSEDRHLDELSSGDSLEAIVYVNSDKDVPDIPKDLFKDIYTEYQLRPSVTTEYSYFEESEEVPCLLTTLDDKGIAPIYSNPGESIWKWEYG